MLGNDRLRVVLFRMEMGNGPLAPAAPDVFIAQIFEQRLAVDQPEGRFFQHRGLRTPDSGMCDLAHHDGMFALPGPKRGRALH